ncbi:hypothetical protein ACCAA_400066 [Candidatus Accumulibacter aalborgensis]|uniref:Uncharacterized protein n=1 Tax=Candidatus Accumulibacter aalborgensis TaxID=1860102 RepID=A0A1A8XTF0_9PROT|nr:hypothetical protein ACCAA_400066 [Candidatus Accumulibacter aalborgensis]
MTQLPEILVDVFMVYLIDLYLNFPMAVQIQSIMTQSKASTGIATSRWASRAFIRDTRQRM